MSNARACGEKLRSEKERRSCCFPKKIKGQRAPEESSERSVRFFIDFLAPLPLTSSPFFLSKTKTGLPFFNADMAAAAHYLTSGGMAPTAGGASPSSAAASAGGASWQMAGLPLTAMAFPGKPPAVAAAAAPAASRPLTSLEVAELRAARERAIKAAEGRRATAVQARRAKRAAQAAKEAAAAGVAAAHASAVASPTPASLGVANATATKKKGSSAAAAAAGATTTRATRAAAAKKGGSSSRAASPPSDDDDSAAGDESPRASAPSLQLSLPRATGAPLPSAVAAATAETARVVGEYHSDEELQRALEATTDEKEAKRLKRLLRNRVSAQQARERKRAYVDGLEGRAIVAERRAAELEASVARLEAEAAMLRKVIQNMRASSA